jgi:hypothetical protein
MVGLKNPRRLEFIRFASDVFKEGIVPFLSDRP